MEKRRIRLVQNWRDGWKWISTNSMLTAAAIQGAWLQMPEDMKSGIDPSIVNAVTIAVLVLGVVGRMLDFSKVKADEAV